MEILFYQVNVTRNIVVGIYFSSFDTAQKYIENHPREGGYHSIEAIIA